MNLASLLPNVLLVGAALCLLVFVVLDEVNQRWWR